MATGSMTVAELRRILIAAGLAAATVLSLAGCPSSSESDPACAQPTAGSTASPDDCADTDTVVYP
ncbi:hypothetical protein ODJ79_27580 [Actinoplanes sp. KI2]|uniref:hypothetical protein n=1 Tax=Actinoplanes sp. KI2 TaxID=2983315 RepID=UPI0021D5F2BA|nr:hypothetical protein [Actinoplanes sp. KI2]MCU7727497.1 hypothetical protein [Actinoplanes sp. KI2]